MWSKWSLQTDLYQLTMVGGYVQQGKKNQWANFDYFFRRIPDDGGYCVLAGLADLIDYIQKFQHWSSRRKTPQDLQTTT